MSGEINGFANTMTEMINTMGDTSQESSSITSALKSVQGQSTEVKASYADMLSKTNKLMDDMHNLSKATLVTAKVKDKE